jgi:nitrogen regulatory protein PII
MVLSMKLLTIVLKPFRAEAVLRALAEMDVASCVVREVKGYSRQKNYLDRYLGSEYTMAFLPKVEITVCVNDNRVDEVSERITSIARTGRMGDGKIFMQPLGWPDAMEF